MGDDHVYQQTPTGRGALKVTGGAGPARPQYSDRQQNRKRVPRIFERPGRNFIGLAPRCHIRKHSALYRVLKNGGNLPEQHSSLIRDGKVTQQGRWLLMACDLGLAFSDLCILAWLLVKHQRIMEAGWSPDSTPPKFFREWVYNTFGETMSAAHIRVALAKLKKRGYIKVAQYHSIRVVRHRMDYMMGTHGDDLVALQKFVDDNCGDVREMVL